MLVNKTKRLNLRSRNNLTRAVQNNIVKESRNPINKAIMGYNNYWKGRRQYVDYLIKYGKINEDQGARYMKLISNNNTTLNNATKKTLKPWLLPGAPPGAKRKTMNYSKNLATNNKGNNNPTRRNSINYGRPGTPDPSNV